MRCAPSWLEWCNHSVASTRRIARCWSRCPFAAGYGVEIGLLLDTHTRHGLNGLAQVNLGVRKHRNRSLLELGVMSRQILGAALPRCGVAEVPGATGITQFVQLGTRFMPTENGVLVAERPPMRDVLAARSA